MEDELLDLERELTGLEKIAHLEELATRLAVLRVAGSDAVQRRYDALIECESAPF
jgi:hypothetical protein